MTFDTSCEEEMKTENQGLTNVFWNWTILQTEKVIFFNKKETKLSCHWGFFSGYELGVDLCRPQY